MSIFGTVFVAMFASLGIALMLLELILHRRAKTAEYICICFREELLNGGLPDMVVICRNEAEKEELIKRICDNDTRRAFIKRI